VTGTAVDRSAWRRLIAVATLLAFCLLPAAARADRRYFLLTYMPHLDDAGESEIEGWATSKVGKQDPGESPTWETRAEWEYTINPRLGAAAYLNFERLPGGPMKFSSPSVEFIYRPAEAGRIPLDPALYLEVTESGDELELEPKLLLATQFAKWVAAVNLVGEFEFRHNDEERLASGAVLRNAAVPSITAGIAYGAGRRVALGLEARALSEHPNFGGQSAALLSAGPSLNLELGRAQLAVGVLPQILGTPRSSGRRNLVDFEKTQVRVVLGFEL
jgi:hypothetical protein